MANSSPEGTRNLKDTGSQARGSRNAFRAVGLVVVLALASFIFIGMLSPGGGSREAPRRTKCKNHLKDIALALHNYHDAYGTFPPAYIADQNGRPMHSWRVLILPY